MSCRESRTSKPIKNFLGLALLIRTCDHNEKLLAPKIVPRPNRYRQVLVLYSSASVLGALFSLKTPHPNENIWIRGRRRRMGPRRSIAPLHARKNRRGRLWLCGRRRFYRGGGRGFVVARCSCFDGRCRLDDKSFRRRGRRRRNRRRVNLRRQFPYLHGLQSPKRTKHGDTQQDNPRSIRFPFRPEAERRVAICDDRWIIRRRRYVSNRQSCG